MIVYLPLLAVLVLIHRKTIGLAILSGLALALGISTLLIKHLFTLQGVSSIIGSVAYVILVAQPQIAKFIAALF